MNKTIVDGTNGSYFQDMDETDKTVSEVGPDGRRKYTNTEIVHLVILALTYGLDEKSDPIIRRSWKALDDTFDNGYQKGYKEGCRAGKSETAMAEVSAERVIKGLFHRM